jgi:CelD/BcsL family acetyltransferase involved in cellulose biosynthesis
VHGTIEQVFRVEWRPLAELATFAAEWRALAGRALEPNAFYEPAFALAAAPVFGCEVGAGLVWSRTSPKLLGLFPARVERRRYGIKLPVLVGWTHPYGPLGTPLVDRDAAVPVIAAWLEHVADHPLLPPRLLLPFLPAEGPLAHAFASALAARGGRSVDFARHRRALLAPGDARTDYLERALPARKRKELRRQRRRLGDRGVVMVGISGEPEVVASGLRDFLGLEASGWKGRAKTAARAYPAVREFVEHAVTQLSAEGKAQIARLFVDSRAVAAIVVLRSGDCTWCWKIAYDERMAQASPGVQLLLDVTKGLLADTGVTSADSCATADHPMIDHIWRERLPLADRFMQVSTQRSAVFRLACTLESLRRAAENAAKALRDRLQPVRR